MALFLLVMNIEKMKGMMKERIKERIAADKTGFSPDFSSVQAASGSKFLAMNYSRLYSLPKY